LLTAEEEELCECEVLDVGFVAGQTEQLADRPFDNLETALHHQAHPPPDLEEHGAVPVAHLGGERLEPRAVPIEALDVTEREPRQRPYVETVGLRNGVPAPEPVRDEPLTEEHPLGDAGCPVERLAVHEQAARDRRRIAALGRKGERRHDRRERLVAVADREAQVVRQSRQDPGAHVARSRLQRVERLEAQLLDCIVGVPDRIEGGRPDGRHGQSVSGSELTGEVRRHERSRLGADRIARATLRLREAEQEVARQLPAGPIGRLGQARHRAGEERRCSVEAPRREQLPAAGERFGRVRRCRRRRPFAWRSRGLPVEAGIPHEHGMLERCELPCRLDPELLPEPAAEGLRGAQRFRLTACPVEGEDQHLPEPLAKGVGGGEALQLGHERTVQPLVHLERHPVLDPEEAELLQALDLGPHQRGLPDVGICAPAPETVRAAQEVRLFLGAPNDAADRDEALELRCVGGDGTRAELVGATPRHDERSARAGVHQPAQPGHIRTEGVAGSRRGSAVPQLVREDVDRQARVSSQRQQCEQRPLTGAAEGDVLVLAGQNHRAEEHRKGLAVARPVVRVHLGGPDLYWR
jgi:hypothetical protein